MERKTKGWGISEGGWENENEGKWGCMCEEDWSDGRHAHSVCKLRYKIWNSTRRSRGGGGNERRLAELKMYADDTLASLCDELDGRTMMYAALEE